MGNTPDSKLHDALVDGDEKRALTCLEELKRKPLRGFDPNEIYSQKAEGNSVMMSAALNACQHVYTYFLKQQKLSLEAKNSQDQNIFHILCRYSGRFTKVQGQKRLQMMENTIECSNCSKVLPNLLNEKDKVGNTPLHCAAASGLQSCVEVLISRGGDVFDCNGEQQTPCDLAMRRGWLDVADYLESRMVLAPAIEQAETELPFPIHLVEEEEQIPRGITVHDVRSAKDVVLIETADLLGVPLFSAEALLKSKEWARDQVIDAWLTDPVETCQKAGIPIPDLTADVSLSGGAPLNPTPAAAPHSSSSPSTDDRECIVCCWPFSGQIQLICEHQCCPRCWESYLTGKVESNDIQDIYCPGYGCFTRVPVDIVERVIPRDTARKFLQYDIKAFVESNANMSWCPEPGCDKVVAMFGQNDQVLLPNENMERRPINVHCGDNHFFCWKCSGEPHEPCSCEQWSDWKRELDERAGQEQGDTVVTANNAATMNNLWLVENSKKCPKCKSHIEKMTGCNHMTCRKCKHDFCWVCLDPWNIHSSATGGYFECRREKEIGKVEKEKEEMLKSARDRVAKAKFADTLKHYETHCKALEEEEHFFSNAESKMEQLKANLEGQLPHSGATACVTDVSFLKTSLFELVKTRLILRASCIYKHNIAANRSKESEQFSKLFEYLVTTADLLGNMVSKSHLRHRQMEIVRATSNLVQERLSFLAKLPELKQLSKDPSPRSSFAGGFEDGPIDLLEQLLLAIRPFDHHHQQDREGGGEPDLGDGLTRAIERRRRLRQRMRHLRRLEERGNGGLTDDNDADDDDDDDDDDSGSLDSVYGGGGSTDSTQPSPPPLLPGGVAGAGPSSSQQQQQLRCQDRSSRNLHSALSRLRDDMWLEPSSTSALAPAHAPASHRSRTLGRERPSQSRRQLGSLFSQHRRGSDEGLPSLLAPPNPSTSRPTLGSDLPLDSSPTLSPPALLEQRQQEPSEDGPSRLFPWALPSFLFRPSGSSLTVRPDTPERDDSLLLPDCESVPFTITNTALPRGASTGGRGGSGAGVEEVTNDLSKALSNDLSTNLQPSNGPYFSNVLSSPPSHEWSLPSLPPLLQPAASPLSRKLPTLSPSPPPPRMASFSPRLAFLDGEEDYDEGEALRRALRESMQGLQPEEVAEELDFEEQLELALALSVQDSAPPSSNTPPAPRVTLSNEGQMGSTDA